MNIIYDNSASNDEDRLRQVLIADKHFNPEKVKQVIKSDIFNILKDYADLLDEDIDIDLEILSDGKYEFKIKATAENLKIFGALPDEI